MKNDIQPLQSISSNQSRRRWAIPVIAVVLTAAAGGGWMVMKAKSAAATEKTDGKSAQKKVETMELGKGDVARIESRELSLTLPVSGSLTPLNQATVKSKVTAEVREALVQEGVSVTRGQVIVRLDSADLRARVATQQAAQEEARARLALATKNRETNTALLTQKYISQNAFDTVQNSVDLAEAGLKSATSQLDIAKRAMDDAVVRAPIEGIINKRYVQPGEKASPDTPLFSIVDLAHLILEVQAPASEIPRIKVGQDVRFVVDGFGNRNFSGKVARINPMAEAASRSMTVYVAVANPDGALKAGMFGKGGITLEKSGVTPLMPIAALRDEAGKSIVYRVVEGKVVAQTVKLGLRSESEGLVEVTDGIAQGDHVIVVKLDGVKPGSPVKLPPGAGAASATPVNASDATAKKS